MSNYLKKHKIFLISLLVFIFAFFSRVYFISQKGGAHIDNVYDMTITSCKYGASLSPVPVKDKIYTGSELKALFTEDPKSFSATTKDIKQLWLNNCGDYAHPNLYYMIFKTLSLPINHFDLKTLINFECGIDLFVFAFSFLFMYKLLRILFKANSWVVPVGLVCSFLNTGAVSITLFGRMYELQSFAAIFLSYVLVLFCSELDKNKEAFTVKNLVLYVFASSLCILSGYFMGFYFALISVYLLFRLIKSGKTEYFPKFLVMMLLVGLVCFTFYPGYLNGLTHHRADQINHIFLNKQSLISVENSYYEIISHFKHFLLYVPVVLIILPCLIFYKKSKNSPIAIHLVVISFLWILISAFLSPEKLLRYIEPVFPLFAMIVPLILNCIEGKKKYVIAFTVVIIYCFNLFHAKSTEFYSFFMEPNGYEIYEPKSDLFSSHIENLYRVNPEFLKHPEIPVVFEYSGPWSYLGLIYNLNDNQKYIFNDIHSNYESWDKYKIMPEMQRYKKYYLMIAFDTYEGPWFRGFKNKKFPCLNIYESPKLSKSIKSKELFETTEVYLIEYE